MALNDKQLRFIDEFFVDFNATAAAKRAGYAEGSGKRSVASTLLTNVNVVAEINTRRTQFLRRFEANRDRVVSELAALSFSDVRDICDWGMRKVIIGYDDDGNILPFDKIDDAVALQEKEIPFLRMKDSSELSPAAAAAIAEVQLTKDGFRVKLHSKPAAIGELSKVLGLIVDKKLTVTTSLEDLIKASYGGSDAPPQKVLPGST